MNNRLTRTAGAAAANFVLGAAVYAGIAWLTGNLSPAWIAFAGGCAMPRVVKAKEVEDEQ